ncbi:MAG: DUF4443 domain-containing protein [Candidatus Altiarchaeota archaeon]
MAGAQPSYKTEHILRTLILLEEGRIGRKKLVKKLGVGEGSVRTILKKLKKEQMITSVKQGHTLSDKGLKMLEKLLEEFTKPHALESFDLACGSTKAMAIVHNASAKVKKGLDERDIAVKAGADGAVILVYKDGKIQFPAGDAGLEELSETRSKIEELDLREGDVVVISFAGDEIKAEDGVLAVITNLVDLEFAQRGLL